MSAVLLGTYEHDTPEWHAARADGIGASEIGVVAGFSPWMSPFNLWHVKKGNLDGQRSSSAMDWGHRLEPLVADRYAELHPEFWVMESGTYANSDLDWQRANPDRRLMPTSGVTIDTEPLGVLEIKTTRYPDGWGPAGSDIVPMLVRCQVVQQMDVMSVDFADVAVLIGGSDYREYRIPFDPEGAETLRQVGQAFWDSLADGDEPPIDASFSTYEAVRKLHPDIDPDEDVEIDPDLFARYLVFCEAVAAEQAEVQQMKTEILAAMGKARRALVDGRPVLRRQSGRNGSVSLYPVKEAS